jgi:hypothetical protein
MDERNDQETEEHYEQPHPGSTGHESERGKGLEEEPEVDEADGAPADDQSEQADQESKHSHPTSDPPANY